ncbi:hypothetical protein GLOIN_2v1840650 [Rhizophagus clarus]|uniref:Uncharacterized protein n=1 Tax=Rhizophagus clarus TaxID=94130 RepID=A0A8H3KSK3_9GLOM|nr:hypothetical protein GLOIN_2v1840650 [Rhizophagus clarus]
MCYYPPDANEEWLVMQCPVPVRTCYSKDVIIYWQHVYCGGRMKIGTHMKIVCTSCNYGALWSTWKFKCSLHDFEQIGNNVDMFGALSRSLNLHCISEDKVHVIETIMRKLFNCKCVFLL